MENPTLGCGPLYVRSSEMCRLCMKSHEYYLNIFVSNEELKTSIGKAIEDLLILKVAKNDNLPEMVCCPCVTKLMEFREFKEMCVNSASEFGRLAPGEPITCQVKDEFPPMQMLREGTSGTWSNCMDGESGVRVVPDDLSLDPFALEDQTDAKEVYPRDPLRESDESGEEDFAETKFSEKAAVFNESKQLLMDDQGEVKKELELTEVVGNGEGHSREINDEGDSSDTGGPILLSDILAVMGMVDHCNNIGGLREEPEYESDKFGADRQGISENKVIDNPSCIPVREENLQLEYSMTNSFVVDCFPEGKVRKQKKNVKFYASSMSFSQLNDRARSVRNHDCEQFCHQSENISHATDYICNYCNTRYSTKKSLAIHIKRHVDGKMCTSVLRMKDFPPRFSQNLLVKDRGNVESVILETSNISFTQNSSRVKNEKLAVEQSSGGQNLGRELNNSRTLLYKIVKPQKKAAFVCDTCGIAFIKRNDLVKHVNVHTGLNTCRYQQKCVLTHTNAKLLKCDVCGKNFKNKKTLKCHSVTHTAMKPFKCNECGKMFDTRSHFNRHSVVHTGVKTFKCNECGKMFYTRSNLNRHSVVHTGVKPFKCNECDKKFSRKSSLEAHLVVHTGVKRFKCDGCGKMFTTSNDLNRHSVIHTGVKPFKCNECGKMFSRKSHLKEHSFIHTGVKRFKCNDCGKMFTQSCTLKTHSLVHTGEKPLKCNECGKMFTQKSHLEAHSVIHTGVKRFKCDECGKMFTTRSYLILHSVVHTGVKPFKCNFCGKEFKWRAGFNSHLLTHADLNPSK